VWSAAANDDWLAKSTTNKALTLGALNKAWSSYANFDEYGQVSLIEYSVTKLMQIQQRMFSFLPLSLLLTSHLLRFLVQ
jgi:hypothetical protein